VEGDEYSAAAEAYGVALERLARAYEADPDARLDLVQDIHLQLWRSLENFDGRCSLRTWVYRVAHNVATSHVMRQRRLRRGLVSIEDVESLPDGAPERPALERDRLYALIQRLKPLDRQIIVCYLEGMDAAATGEITGLSAANVAMKIHRIKNVLKRWFHEV
jgi:RNA polymerase sigma-70 factor (ECF subfamily)